MNKAHRFFSFLIAAMLLACAAGTTRAQEDPPSRTARIKDIGGQVSVQPAGVDEWADAVVNRPLTTGDNVWADRDSRVELGLGSAVIRMGSETSLTLSNVSDNVVQLGLNQGVLNLRVRHLFEGETYEVDTPNMAFTVWEKGNYRFSADPNSDTTLVTVRSGKGEASGDGPAVDIVAGQMVTFTNGRSLQNEVAELPGYDPFDNWAREQDEREDRAAEHLGRYVSPDMVGYEDLDENGRWVDSPEYGHVWVPAAVAPGWAPYQYGHWAWVAPWGWTWVDDAPWGFAPFHYGRWVFVGGAWAWTPGPVVEVAVRPVYAPALVAWVGGVGISVGGGVGVGWFALGWGDPFIPTYAVSRNYFTQVNVTNTRITNITNITNNYYVNNTTVINNTKIVNINYANRNVPGAVTVVPQGALANAQPVHSVAVKVTPEQLKAAKPMVTAPVVPSAHAVLGAKPNAARTPPAKVFSKPLAAKTTPPPRPVPFAAKQALMAKNPGVPVSPQAEAQIRKSLPPPKTPAPVVVKATSPAPAGKNPPSGRNAPPPAPPKPGAPPRPGAATAPPPPRQPATATRPAPEPPRPPANERPAPPPRPAPPAERAAPPRPSAPEPEKPVAPPERAAPPRPSAPEKPEAPAERAAPPKPAAPPERAAPPKPAAPAERPAPPRPPAAPAERAAPPKPQEHAAPPPSHQAPKPPEKQNKDKEKEKEH